MSLLSWSVSETTWLTVTNIILGVVAALCALIMAGGVVHEIVARIRKRRRIEAEIDRDMRMLNDDQVFHLPNK